MTFENDRAGPARSDAIFVDANIPMYAAGGDPSAKRKVLAAIRRAVEDDIPLVTSAEVFQEILHRYFSTRRYRKAEIAYRFLAEICTEILPVEERHTARALELLQVHRDIAARDALHAAVMEDAGITAILTEDRQLGLMPGIRRVAAAELAAAP